MNILLLGATGTTGREILRQALLEGHNLTVLVRNPEKITSDKTNLRIIVGDATNIDKMRWAMVGNEVVISALGAISASLLTEATRAILKAAKHTNLKRIIMLSSFAVNRNQLTMSARLLTGIVMKKILDDKDSAENLLRDSGFNCTIVYAAPLANTHRGASVRAIPASEKVGLKNKIERTSVAAWILDELKSGSYNNRDATISQ